MRSIHESIAEALEARAVPDIDELVPGQGVHVTIMTRHVR
jgi:hypothetical protein